MSEPDLTFQQIAHRLRLDDVPLVDPPVSLWPRIASAHRQRLRRAHARRLAACCAGCCVVLAALLGVGASWSGRSQPDVDWQARAQALELQLRALNAAAPDRTGAAAVDAQNELVLVDGALQAAYDDGAGQERVSALWKRRSELLDALVNARRQNMQISRI